MPDHTLRKALAAAVTRITYESTSPEVYGVCKAWLDDIGAMLTDVGPPVEGHCLVHLDKTKWYGPGNVKWLPVHMVSRFRRDSVKLKDYYARTPVIYGTKIPKRQYMAGVADRARELNTTPYYVRKALASGTPVDAVSVVKSPRGRPATLRDDKSISQWAKEAGVSVYRLRKHMSNSTPMSVAAQAARKEAMGR